MASVKLGRFTKDIILYTSKPFPVAKYLRQELSHIQNESIRMLLFYSTMIYIVSSTNPASTS